MESPVVKVKRQDILTAYRAINGGLTKLRQLLAEADLREYSETCLTQSLKDDTQETELK